MYRRFGKRYLDLTLALGALVLLSPLMLLVAALVRVYLGPGVLFRQTRPGLHGRPFDMLKFRTMTDARSPSGRLRPDAERLTAFGRFLRSTSLDELPGLINVIRGEMSLVGPRPLLMRYLERYSPEQRRRHDVLPGITGWAQVNGRNAISWEERFALDLWYVKHCSLAVDLLILGLTVVKVLQRSDITQRGQATVEEFRGTPSLAAAGRPELEARRSNG
jgi:sugar transferase EpsL